MRAKRDLNGMASSDECVGRPGSGDESVCLARLEEYAQQRAQARSERLNGRTSKNPLYTV
jgi:hypothetical protein